MKTLRPVPIKKLGKLDREKKVLLGLVDHYIQTGKAVGSNALKDEGFEDLSSATIRNYFANLEDTGYLTQSHSSGGRIPTAKAYRAYAQSYIDDTPHEGLETNAFHRLKEAESKEITTLLQTSAELLSQETQCAVFLSAPRFDHDFVTEIKLVPLDIQRCLSIVVTDFGTIQTEVMYLPTKLSAFALKRMESYFHWRLTGIGKPENIEPEEEAVAQRFYNELMVRYIVGYSNFIDEDVYKTGFSRLLGYVEFQDPTLLAKGLALFENAQAMRLILRETKSLKKLKCWIDDDLMPYTANNPNCGLIAHPYFINKTPVGAVGILGPMRIPYRKMFSILKEFVSVMSELLTKNIYKHKISYRQPTETSTYLQKEEHRLIGQSRLMLIEDQREEEK